MTEEIEGRGRGRLGAAASAKGLRLDAQTAAHVANNGGRAGSRRGLQRPAVVATAVVVADHQEMQECSHL